MFSICDKCGHKAYDHDERGDPMGCQVSGCPCREYKDYLRKDHNLATVINKDIDEFRAKHRYIPITREQELEKKVVRLELARTRAIIALAGCDDCKVKEPGCGGYCSLWSDAAKRLDE